MFIIAGLGNPGREYANTRHNVGFDTIDVLADKYHIDVDTRKHKALIGKGMIEGQKVILVKPQTYMNLSGESIREVLDFYKVDETSGIKSIIQHLGGQEFLRIKVGVGEKPKGYDLADYVLGHFSKEEQVEMEEAKKRAAEAAVMMVCGDVEKAMNEYNRKV